MVVELIWRGQFARLASRLLGSGFRDKDPTLAVLALAFGLTKSPKGIVTVASFNYQQDSAPRSFLHESNGLRRRLCLRIQNDVELNYTEPTSKCRPRHYAMDIMARSVRAR
jgi:hypothetical protein